MREYAILYKREMYDDQNKIYYFKPCYIVEGISSSTEKIFLDNMNMEIPYLNHPKVMSGQIELCVASIIEEKVLMQTFKSARNIEEAKKMFMEEMEKNILITTNHNDQIEVEYISKELYDSNPNKDLLQQNSPNYYQKYLEYNSLKQNYSNGEEFTLLLEEDMDYLLNTKVIEELKGIITALKNEKLLYLDKINSIKKEKNPMIMIITDRTIEQILKETDLEKIKKQLIEIKIGTEQIQKKLHETSEEQTLIEYYEEFYYSIMNKNSIEEIKNDLEIEKEDYIEILKLIDTAELEEKDYKLCQKVITNELTEIEKLLLNNSLESIQIIYRNLYSRSFNSIEEVSEILKSYGMVLLSEQVEEQIITEKEDQGSTIKKIQFNYLAYYEYMTSKIVDRNSQISSILSLIDMVDNNPNKDKKMAGLIIGTAGTGKTQTFTELKRIFSNRPVILTDTNQITAEGYVGGSIEQNILAPLLQQAHTINNRDKEEIDSIITKEDLLLAQHGIVFLDEIDKRRKNDGAGPDVNGEDVVNALLKLMDGTEYRVKVDKTTITFDTSDLVIFAGGAFEEYFEERKKSPGFIKKEENEENFRRYNEINPEELVKYGFSYQAISRFTSIILYPQHTKSSLMKLEKNKTTSTLENRRKLFENNNVTLVWDDEFLTEAIEEALKLKKGGRGLSQIIARCTDIAYDEIKKHPDEYKILYLTEDSIKNPNNAILIRKDKSFVLTGDIVKKNELEVIEKYSRNEIEIDKKALEEALKYKKALTAPKTTELKVVVPEQKALQKIYQKR